MNLLRWYDIEDLDEKQAKTMAIETAEIKGFNVYFIDFGEYFNYCALVYKDGRHINHASLNQLTDGGNTAESEGQIGLKNRYVKILNDKLFTEDEIVGPVKSYKDFSAKLYFLQNLYSQQRESVSFFNIFHNEEEEAEYDRKVSGMIRDAVGLCYYYPKVQEFVKHHYELREALFKAKDQMKNDYDYWFNAFLYEMYNHEYMISWNGDYNTLSTFGHITPYDGAPLNKWFKELQFTDTQIRAYHDAVREINRREVA